MAKNTKLYRADNLELEVGSGIESGDAVAVGDIVGVALTDANDDDIATIRTTGTATFKVEANDGDIELGDIVYYDDGDIVGDDTGNVRFGYALEEVGDGETEEIEVKIGY